MKMRKKIPSEVRRVIWIHLRLCIDLLFSHVFTESIELCRWRVARRENLETAVLSVPFRRWSCVFYPVALGPTFQTCIWDVSLVSLIQSSDYVVRLYTCGGSFPTNSVDLMNQTVMLKHKTSHHAIVEPAILAFLPLIKRDLTRLFS